MSSSSREMFISINEKVAAADPLGADSVMAILPKWNETANLKDIVQSAQQLRLF